MDVLAPAWDSLPAKTAAERTTELFQQLWNPLCRYLLSLGLPLEEAGEAAQEAFLRLYQQLVSGGDEANLRGWVFRVAHNFAQNERKRGRRRDCQPLSDLVVDTRSTPEYLTIEQDKMKRME